MSQAGAARRPDGFTIFLGIACAALAVLVVLLSIQNRRLKEEIADLAARSAVVGGTWSVGDPVGSLTLRSVDGESKVAFPPPGASGSTALLVFSTTCPACRETFPWWNELTRQVGPDRIAGVRTDAGHGEESAEVLEFPVYAFDPDDPGLAAKFPFVPATVVFDARGTVTEIVFGVPSGEKREAILKAVRG